MMLTCGTCGIAFERERRQYRAGKPTYCSQACFGASCRSTPEQEAVSKERQRLKMWARYWQGREHEWKPRAPYGGTTTLACKECGESFERSLGNETRRQHDSEYLSSGAYCSLECYRSRTADRELVRSRQRAKTAEWRKRNRLHVSAYKRARFLPKDSADDHDYIQILLGDPCSYCGAKAEAVDHIDALSRGGDNDWTNLTAACRSCNSRKATKSLGLFMAAAYPAAHEELQLVITKEN